MMESFTSGPWQIDYDRKDGARLARIVYDGFDLLTAPRPARPATPYRQDDFLSRPVFGYDDCFPTVDPCLMPGTDLRLPDHGELCWQAWEVTTDEEGLAFETASPLVSARFVRRLHCTADTLLWNFTVANTGDTDLPFLHVMHPLMDPGRITGITLPACGFVYDEGLGGDSRLATADQAARYLLDLPPGQSSMLLLRKVKEGRALLRFRSGPELEFTFPHERFPTLGLWWNRTAGSEGRDECAIEPIPGSFSSLEESYRDRSCLVAAPGQTVAWRVAWRMSAG